MRLDRYLSNQGLGSRTEVRRLIRSGKITVNELTARDEGLQIKEEQDKIKYLETPVVYRKYHYLMMNKPAGVLSATNDLNQRTVLDLLTPVYHNRGLFPVGRLDKDTEGLLLITNNGELGHQLLAPKKKIVKRYFARVNGMVIAEDQEAFAAGILLADGYRTLAANLEILKADQNGSEVLVFVHEGKFHQIKRMFLALGKEVVYLKRMAMGPLELDPALGPGEYRELTPSEIASLHNR